MVNVTITLGDENDNRPTFTRPYYSTVLTSHELGTSVVTVKAVDGDEGKNGRVAYTIAHGPYEYYFSIDSRYERLSLMPVFHQSKIRRKKTNTSTRSYRSDQRKF
jgi:hypothetical protein